MISNRTTADLRDRFAVKTTGLTRWFDDLTAADHLDLAIPYGEIFGLLAANGAGTTTLIKMLTNLLIIGYTAFSYYVFRGKARPGLYD